MHRLINVNHGEGVNCLVRSVTNERDMRPYKYFSPLTFITWHIPLSLSAYHLGKRSIAATRYPGVSWRCDEISPDCVVMVVANWGHFCLQTPCGKVGSPKPIPFRCDSRKKKLVRHPKTRSSRMHLPRSARCTSQHDTVRQPNQLSSEGVLLVGQENVKPCAVIIIMN